MYLNLSVRYQAKNVKQDYMEVEISAVKEETHVENVVNDHQQECKEKLSLSRGKV